MPTLRADNISYCFSDGQQLFHNISCSLDAQCIGLVGRNGVGKSILASVLSGERTASTGTVVLPDSIGYYRQESLSVRKNGLTIAQFVEKSKTLEALSLIEAGHVAPELFDQLDDEWDIRDRLSADLIGIGLPDEFNLPCKNLSGGQLARLRLWKLFNSNSDLLILDEPSNHLDTTAKAWLLQNIKNCKKPVLLVSHDRELLRIVDEIWELTSLGLKVYGGNYDVYRQLKSAETNALKRAQSNIAKQQRQLINTKQKNKEKSDRRSLKGRQVRAKGSQPKVLMDGKKDRAETNTSSRLRNESKRQSLLDKKAQSIAQQHEALNQQSMYLNNYTERNRQLVSIVDGVLPYGSKMTINIQIYARDKVSLTGGNGSGKSTLLKTLLGDTPLKQGELQTNTGFYYLDQHFSMVQNELSVLENLLVSCADLSTSAARISLAGIGFRGDSVYRQGGKLSGGEKMKLAMSMASHRPEPTMLLLDEPDNHLDLDSKILLSNSLKNYRAGFILVSHDQDFVCESGVSKTWELC